MIIEANAIGGVIIALIVLAVGGISTSIKKANSVPIKYQKAKEDYLYACFKNLIGTKDKKNKNKEIIEIRVDIPYKPTGTWEVHKKFNLSSFDSLMGSELWAPVCKISDRSLELRIKKHKPHMLSDNYSTKQKEISSSIREKKDLDQKSSNPENEKQIKKDDNALQNIVDQKSIEKSINVDDEIKKIAKNLEDIKKLDEALSKGLIDKSQYDILVKKIKESS